MDVCGVAEDAICFLDLPFYERGRYRQFSLGDTDIELCRQQLEEFKPHQVYATGHIADPSSVQSLCFAAVDRALDKCTDTAWREACRMWLYRGKETALGVDEIDMAVPMSPDQVSLKTAAIRKFQSISIDENLSTKPNIDTADDYDDLGLAEYEAIEAFERLW